MSSLILLFRYAQDSVKRDFLKWFRKKCVCTHFYNCSWYKVINKLSFYGFVDVTQYPSGTRWTSWNATSFHISIKCAILRVFATACDVMRQTNPCFTVLLAPYCALVSIALSAHVGNGDMQPLRIYLLHIPFHVTVLDIRFQTNSSLAILFTLYCVLTSTFLELHSEHCEMQSLGIFLSNMVFYVLWQSFVI